MFRGPGLSMSAPATAQHIYRGLAQGRDVVVPGIVNKVSQLASRLAIKSLIMQISLLDWYRPFSVSTNIIYTTHDGVFISSSSSIMMTGVCLRSDPAAAASRGGCSLAASVGPRALLAALPSPVAQDGPGAAAAAATATATAAERSTTGSAGMHYINDNVLTTAHDLHHHIHPSAVFIITSNPHCRLTLP